ncbi:comG operon protein 1 [Alkalihalophilus pseudofirmus OF4]|uniref:ComG operon protein 1 n=1 Tax=Alkalihalophilus pseudofirmus (strain ATCC BAA-2126 / JCM 17055 / OF4) TaxID=398511 RepID=D3FUZ1_ALKPO|nr:MULTISPECIES: competence type IV pilus ATPase ComGA [Alkalihalophilus]ADC48417.1 comG operon protein 1 [Alkalihalophilus pseudofirmus OF4]MED1601086.1 competence type IV pilus ATPase ComGA [Alkalihalophilus marmarensis]
MYDVEKISMAMFEEAVSVHATDIHLVPLEREWLIQFRMNGTLYDYKSIPLMLGERVLGHLKYHCGMDIGERRFPQSNAMTIVVKKEKIDLRLSTLPTRSKESLAVRLLPQKRKKELIHLPILSSNVQQLQYITTLRQGLCLISGPTGSGKTTTLYACLEEILYTSSKKIITIEDPVERTLDYLIQIETNDKAGITFDIGLKAALRHDPDVIMIGEIRDEKTAKLAVRAALTGHLVFATVHANNNYSAVLRMLEFGVSKQDVCEGLQAVICQCLVNRQSKVRMEVESFNHMPIYNRGSLYTFDHNEQIRKMVNKGLTREANTLENQLRKAWALGYTNECERGGEG